MRYKAYNQADSSIKLDDEFVLTCILHGEIGRSFWPSVFEYIVNGHDREEGDHEYILTNETTGQSSNPFYRA